MLINWNLLDPEENNFNKVGLLNIFNWEEIMTLAPIVWERDEKWDEKSQNKNFLVFYNFI